MIVGFSIQHLRFHLEPKAPLCMPAYNKGNVIRGGFGSTFRCIVVSCELSRAGEVRPPERMSVHGVVSTVCSGRVGEDKQEPGLLGQPADFDEAFDRLELEIAGQNGCVQPLGGRNAECIGIGERMLAFDLG